MIIPLLKLKMCCTKTITQKVIVKRFLKKSESLKKINDVDNIKKIIYKLLGNSNIL